MPLYFARLKFILESIFLRPHLVVFGFVETFNSKPLMSSLYGTPIDIIVRELAKKKLIGKEMLLLMTHYTLVVVYYCKCYCDAFFWR